MTKIDRVKKYIYGLNGKIFSCEFKKKTTGEVRKFNCRTGVGKYVKGIGQKFDPAKKNLLGVFVIGENDKKGAECYRFINLEGVISINGRRI